MVDTRWATMTTVVPAARGVTAQVRTMLAIPTLSEDEKRKVGARPVPMVAYVQTEDLYNHTIIEAMGLEGGQ